MRDLIATAQDPVGDRVRQWNAAGGRVVGYACVFTPVEIVEAAGLLPLRLRPAGRSETELADARLARFNCSFCRACLQLGLDGTYDFLDGMIETNGCDQLRGMFENWQYARPTPFFHYLKGPHFVAPESLAYFTDQLRQMAAALAKHFEVDITPDKLAAAVARQRRIRAKLHRLYERREAQPSRLDGATALAIVLHGGAMPAADYEALLDDVLASPPAAVPAPRARLLLGGAATDEIGFVEMIEALGGAVVTDTLCFGARAFWPMEAETRADPYEDLAALYLQNGLCPRMVDRFDDRLAFTLAALQRSHADGAILVHNKFCDVHGIDNTLLRLRLEARGVPVLTIEKEYGALADLGRMRTRVQAFLERIGGRS